MRKIFMIVIGILMTVSVSAQFYIYLSDGRVLQADSISIVAPSVPSEPTFPPRDGVLSGAFSVSDTSKVVFSHGNLQYHANTGLWRFAEHQYDTIGAGNKNVSASYSGWIDLFGWGTGNNPTNASTDDKNYATFTDWGVKSILNGGNRANQWRTLAHSEWIYLFDTRPNASNLRGQATVNGVHGYVILADDFVFPTGLIFTANPNNWTTNVYTVTEWSQLESVGAVFLPAAGGRDGVAVYNVGSYGSYWSSTPDGENRANDLSFGDGGAGTVGSDSRGHGHSVRLVQDFK